MKLKAIIILVLIIFLFSSEEEKLRLINERIENIKQRLEDLKKDKGSVLNDIFEIELRYEKEKIEINKIDMQLGTTKQKLVKMELKKKKLEAEIEKSKENIRKMIRILYKLGSNAYLKLFLKIENLDQLFKNYRLLISLIDYNIDEINMVKEKIIQVEKLTKTLEEEHKRILNFKSLRNLTLSKMQKIKNEKIQLITNINKDKSNYLKLLDELRFEADRLNQLINKQGIKGDIRIIDVDRLKGKLNWPIEGNIISFFGKEKSTRFNTYIYNNGIKIKPKSSNEVKAVYYGEVIYADYFMGGYGNLIILEHAKNFHSLYGHCEKFLKKQGEKVKEGESIAIVGDTGSILGKLLHFEIRKDLKAQNPLYWLMKQ